MPPVPITTRPPAGLRSRAAPGFTLIEAAMVLVIIGIGVLGMLQLLAAGTVANGNAAGITTAMSLASNIRELSLGLEFYDPNQVAANPDPNTLVWNSKEASVELYDNITDLDGPADTWDKANDPSSGYQKFSPPIDGTRKPVTGYANWAQHVKVETVDPIKMRSTLPHLAKGEAVRVTVKVTHYDELVYQTSWIVVAPLARDPVPG